MQEQHHVYQRNINTEERTSLSVLASMIFPGALVLDLGCGSGALGNYLHQQSNCIVDGITFNAQEAALASADYRHVIVGDLEQSSTISSFSDNKYDFIVCADVLEHLKAPEAVLQQCRSMLAPRGKLLISIPNASYSGLVLELMQGEFQYREEGLLDSTHLRFFTRRSLGRFLNQHCWHIEHLDTIERPLDDSEFRDIATDALPPALVRHLLARPNALSYQIICTATPSENNNQQELADAPHLPQAFPTFTTTLYWANRKEFCESQKHVVRANIGQMHQKVHFQIPYFDGADPALRWDPADRPGFTHLDHIVLKNSEGQVCWRMAGSHSEINSARQDISWQPALATSPDSGLMLLHSDDPWMQLPIPSETLRQCLLQGPATLEVHMGWPMSADYACLAPIVSQLQKHLQAEKNAYAQQQQLRQAVKNNLQTQQQRNQQLQEICEHYANDIEVLRHEISLMREHIAGQDIHIGNQQAHIDDVNKSRAYRLTQKLLRIKQRLLLKQPPPALAGSHAPHIESTVESQVSTPLPAETVDIIVPVYRGLADTQRCIHAVLQHAEKQNTQFQLIVINDASPEPLVTQWLRDIATQHECITLLENESNLGFVGTVNRGMALHPTHDVLLLNSDTEVANNWLDRLRAAAYQNPRNASVTPLSNNATICSYPKFCEPNPLPEGMETTDIDALCARINPQETVSIPTAVGFCMYIRRDCLNQIGLFDEEHFGKGYGEENDFCMRAIHAGWQHVLALDTFVLHTGGVSFGASKGPREQAAGLILLELHPQYDKLIQQHVTQNPAESARQRIDKERLRTSHKRRILMVCHNSGGGTLQHMQELARALHEQAIFLVLSPSKEGYVKLQWLHSDEAYEEHFHWDSEFEQMLATLRDIGLHHIHYHHLKGLPEKITHLPARLGLSYDFTAHDYYTACPQIFLSINSQHYCQEEGDAQCAQCAVCNASETVHNVPAWRDRHQRFLECARNVFAPSLDTAQRLQRYFPRIPVRYAAHLDLATHTATALPAAHVYPIGIHRNLRVFVLGAVSPIKGSNVLENVAIQAASSNAPLEFHLLGYAHRTLKTQPQASLSVHGPYEGEHLVKILERLKPDVVWFPALIPETYSYTLSACLQAGVPIVAPNLGAFPERLSERTWTWIRPWNTAPTEWLEFFETLRTQHFASAQPPEPASLSSLWSTPEALAPWNYASDYLAGLPAPEALPAHIH